MSKTRIISIIVGGVLMVAAFSVQAATFQSKDTIYVGEDEVISNNFFAAGSSITVDGKVQGDIICAGRSITINGFVDGDVLCAGQSITINGEVRGNVRAAGSSITINGKVARNVMVAGSEINLGNKAEVAWDMMFAGAFADIHGQVKRDLEGAGNKLVVGGTIARNVMLFSDSGKHDKQSDSSITILKSAVINGDLTYTSGFEADIEEGAMVKGETTHHERMMGANKGDGSFIAVWLWWKIISIFAALLIGLVLVSWLRRPVEAISQRMFVKPFKTLGYGLLFSIITPIVCFLLFMTVIGIPLALAILALWFIALWLAKIITAIVVVLEIMKRRSSEQTRKTLVVPMIVGIVVSYIIFAIPVLGWLLCLLAVIFGMGGIWTYGREKSQRQSLV